MHKDVSAWVFGVVGALALSACDAEERARKAAWEEPCADYAAALGGWDYSDFRCPNKLHRMHVVAMDASKATVICQCDNRDDRSAPAPSASTSSEPR